MVNEKAGRAAGRYYDDAIGQLRESLAECRAQLGQRPDLTLVEYRGLLDALRSAEAEASTLHGRADRLEQALRMARDCHSVKQVRTIVRTALADGPAVAPGDGGRP